MAISRRQIEQLVENIVQSPPFAGGEGYKRAEKLRELLKFIVERFLSGENVSEMVLLLDFFQAEPADIGADNAIARKYVARLRKKLEFYSQSYGVNDDYSLSLPKGQYTPVFKNNDRSAVQKQIALGFHQVDRENPIHLTQALDHFEAALVLDPNCAEAYAGKASVWLTQALHDYLESPEELLMRAEQSARKGCSLDSMS